MIGEDRMKRVRLFAAFFLAGAFSQTVQALMGREMLVVFYGNEVSLGIFLAAWLFWIAAGSWCSGLAASRIRRPGTWFTLLLGLLPAASASGILLLRTCRRFVDVSSVQLVALDQLALWTLTAVLPVGLLVGALFPLACRALGEERDIPKVYVWDALGGLAGGVLFTWLLVDRFSVWQSLGLLSAALGAVIALSGGRWPRVCGAGWAVLGLALLTPFGGRLDAWAETLRWKALLPGLQVVESFDTPYQNIALARLGEQTSVAADGKIVASFPEEVENAARAALIMSEHPKAESVLMVEGAAGGLVPELLKYPVQRITLVEPDEKAFLRVRARMPESWRAALSDKRVRLRFTDPRLFFDREAGEKYDLILLLLPDPATANLNRFFTAEFYERAAASLSNGGVLVTRATSAENYLGRDVQGYASSVYDTLRSVFADVRATPGDTTLFFASDSQGRLSLDPAVLARRYMGVRLERRRIPPEDFFSMLPAGRVRFVEESLRKRKGEVNTDRRPVAYYLNMLLWSNFTGSGWLESLETIRRTGERFFLVPLLVFILLRLVYGLTEDDPDREARFCSGLSLAALGFAAMAMEIVLLYSFQSRYGYIYKKIGLLNGLFMAGLAAGAFAAGRLGRGGTARRRLAAALLVSACYAAALPGLLEGLGGERVFWGLVLATGVLAGAGFPPASKLHHAGSGEVGLTSGVVDSADHLGGVLGAMLTGTCLVPLLGVGVSCRFAAAVLALASLPLVLAELKCVPALRRPAAAFAGLPVLRLRERAEGSAPFKRLGWLLAGGVLTVWLMTGMTRPEEAAPLEEFSRAGLEAVTGFESFDLKDQPFKHYLETGGRAAAFATYPLTPDIMGYSGPIQLLLGISKDGRVLGYRLLESKETPSYIEGIDRWLERFRGKDATKELRLGKDVDAMTGATVTSEAVVRILNRSAKRAGGVLGYRVSAAPRPKAPPHSAGAARFWVIAVLLAAFFPVFLSGRKRLRLVYLAASAGVMGFAFNRLFTLVDITNIAAGRLPGLDNAVWYLVAGFILLTSLLWGQVFCGFVCPFGALQELLWNLGRRLGLTAYPHVRLDRYARSMKYLLLSAALVLYRLSGRAGWVSFNPMQYFFSLKMPGIMVILSVTVLAASLLYFRFWCRYFCPAGAFLSLFNKLALAQAWAPERECSLCDQGVRTEYDVDCIQCQRCIHHPAYERRRKGGVGE